MQGIYRKILIRKSISRNTTHRQSLHQCKEWWFVVSGEICDNLPSEKDKRVSDGSFPRCENLYSLQLTLVFHSSTPPYLLVYERHDSNPGQHVLTRHALSRHAVRVGLGVVRARFAQMTHEEWRVGPALCKAQSCWTVRTRYCAAVQDMATKPTFVASNFASNFLTSRQTLGTHSVLRSERVAARLSLKSLRNNATQPLEVAAYFPEWFRQAI